MLEPRFNGRVKPTSGVAGVKPYSVPRHPASTDLKLDANEGEAPSPELLALLAEKGPDVMRRYPDASALQAILAKRMGVPPECLIVTAGGDDSLDRLCRSILSSAHELLTTDPGFEMLPRYARLAGAPVVEVPWLPGDPFPTDAMIAAIKPNTTLVAFVSPNNPTGAVGTADDLRRLSEAAPQAIILADFAYIEFADIDLTEVALSLPNVVMVRTLSKAFGLAGLRVGYAVGPREVIGWMRAAGGPYAVARPSIALAATRLEKDDGGMERFVAQVRKDRARVVKELESVGVRVYDSQGNFVFAETDSALWLRDIMAGLGIAIRAYPGHPRLGRALRITLPGNAYECERLVKGIRSAFAPETILFWFAGVLDTHGKMAFAPQDIGRLAMRTPLALVSAVSATGVAAFLAMNGIERYFREQTYAESPSPEDRAHATRRALIARGASTAWVVCRLREQVLAARAAGVVPMGFIPEAEATPEAVHELLAAGAARVFHSIDGILEQIQQMPTLLQE
ncbi:aminotransferase class I/II-fold pyridoxal phosphate-dependent enzyme [bacterium]|nr:aminotransferase class I/II-fold pyridoxal phosphate-dependent enzyme [bacterium]